MILFQLGRILATPGAIDALNLNGANDTTLLMRHSTGDWGDVGEDDAARNREAL